ncbi:MAG: branched-chain amino acid ABC transporter permease [Betaproteobacteria bacterium]|nr:branched-chain amino acid ABC transporter permease [Betaproteobacteria bacterium]NBT11468.1 branched-chain amino acid ABC transporter permease [Betaproteobacteria bacterium]NBU49302.1 branched-chain amino acid ABC transporter permease [Betaproteobacteria bacterium]NBX95788.1 branched-chain amino acid ABC transporter permease [Betaproteobacteria bacterium]
MIDFLQTTLDGLLDGGSYALVGLGLSLTFGSLRRLNLAYGATAMLAAYIGAWLHIKHQAPLGLVALSVIVAATLIGLYVERLCFAATRDDAMVSRGAPIAGADGREVVALASSFAIWMQLEQLAVNLLPRHLNAFPSLAVEQNWFLGTGSHELMIRPDRLVLALLAAALTLGLAHWLERSRAGLSWRAVADHRTAAHLMGMPVARLQTLGFAAACALSGIAAFAVLSVDGQVTPMFGMWVLFKGLVAAMLGGLGSVRGVWWGGLLLGVVEAHAQTLLGAQGREFATYALLFAVLVWPRRSLADKPAESAESTAKATA